MSSRVAVKNFSFGLLKTIITMSIGLISTPLLLKYIDEESFGTFKTLSEFISYFQLLEIGLYSTLLNLMIKSVSHSDHSLTSEIQIFCLKKYLKIFLLILMVGIVFYPFQHFLYRNSTIASSKMIIAYIILLLSFVFLPINVLKAELETNQKIYHIHVSLLLASLLSTISSIIFSYYGFGLVGLCSAYFLGVLISNLYISFVLKNSGLQLILRFKKSKVSPELKKLSSTFQKANFLIDLSGKICLFSDQILISIILGAKNVVPYFVTQRLIYIVLTQLNSLSSSSWAGIGASFHQDRDSDFKNSVLKLTKLVSVFGCMVLLPIFVFNREFISLWVGASRYGGDMLTGITCLTAYFLSLFSVWGWTFTAASKSHQLTKVLWVQAVINIVGSIYFTNKYGILGPAIGTLIACLIVPLPQMTLLLKSVFKFSVKDVTLHWLPPLILSLVLIPFLNFFKTSIVVKGWWAIILSMSAISLIYMAISYLIILNKNEKNWFIKIIKRKLGLSF